MLTSSASRGALPTMPSLPSSSPPVQTPSPSPSFSNLSRPKCRASAKLACAGSRFPGTAVGGVGCRYTLTAYVCKTHSELKHNNIVLRSPESRMLIVGELDGGSTCSSWRTARHQSAEARRRDLFGRVCATAIRCPCATSTTPVLAPSLWRKALA